MSLDSQKAKDKNLYVTIGTQGDVQLYIALGLGLKATDHEVTVATIGDFDEDHPRIEFSDWSILTSSRKAVCLGQKVLLGKNGHSLTAKI